MRVGNLKEALPLLQLAAARDPASFESWYYLAAVHLESDAPSQAAAALRKATLINGNHSEARRLLGETCAQLEDWRCAARELSQHARIRTIGSLRGRCDTLSAAGAALVEAS
ncbi:hypothetical protein T484DRAFT_2611393 [Baffinella frigidus]|nr:hypothetical protein T484DRAFT_2611393 [Cryptophyta sp. CCMP2293]